MIDLGTRLDDMAVVHTRVKRQPTTEELREWVLEELNLDSARAAELISRVDEVVARQRQLVEESKHDAIRALSEGFAAKMERLQRLLARPQQCCIARRCGGAAPGAALRPATRRRGAVSQVLSRPAAAALPG